MAPSPTLLLVDDEPGIRKSLGEALKDEGYTLIKAERILQPFAQAKPEDAARGWGLGLSICLSLLELQRGELRVRSEPGQGATFIISLPLLEG